MTTNTTEAGVAGDPNPPKLNENSVLTHEENDQDQTDKAELARYLTPNHQIRPEIAEGMRSHSPQIQLESATMIRRLTQLLGHPAEVGAKLVIDSGILPTIINMLSSEDVGLVSESAWTLANVSAGTSEQTSAVVEGGAIPKLITIFRSTSNGTKQSVLIALGNIVADSSRLRELVLKEGGLEPALDVLEDPERYPAGIIEIAAWMIARGTKAESDRCILLGTTKPIMPILLKFILCYPDDTAEPLSQVIKTLRKFVTNAGAIKMVIDSGITPRLVRLCRCVAGDHDVQEDALRLLSRFTTERSEHVQAALDNGFLDALHFCLGARVKVRVACWAAGNIARHGRVSQATTLLESPLITLIVGIAIDAAAPLDSRQEAAKALSYAARFASYNTQFLRPLLEARCIEALTELLPSEDGRIGDLILHGIDYFMQSEWSGRVEAMARFEASDGIRRLRDYPRV
ncbi:hypothetical protein M407DRAFT_19067 [Tulasnella calospora MUT 4182]|uniref:Importin subunit alpha n=1 Tax=Tulasnella calospora MUT 4182 TaxID=1051891 RepID=A0A0C3QSQ1_9AGAM|nr:hypothetical protein M407DRAFT_19067 [Tulasnella calospora MUT 4182]